MSLPKGLWRKSTYNGSTSNALVPDSLTDLGGGACFNDARVQVALLGGTDRQSACESPGSQGRRSVTSRDCRLQRLASYADWQRRDRQ